MAGFLHRIFGARAKAQDVAGGGKGDRTVLASAEIFSEVRVRRIGSHEWSFALMHREACGRLGDFVAQDEPYRVGDRIGGMHKVIEVLGGPGNTGMGVVYVCERYGAASRFVLKTFQDRFLRNASVREAFQREAVNHVRLGWHPHIVTANTVLVWDGRPFIDMLYVPPDAEGRRTLADHLAALPAGHSLATELACRLAIQICYGMEHAAAMGVTPHQDLKPGNVLLADGWNAMVADFGLARAAEADLSAWRGALSGPKAPGSAIAVATKRGARVVGTPPWMSPEHFEGRTDQRSDIYALGIILFQMAFGRYPYQSTDYEYAHRTEPPPPLAGPFAPIVHRALAKDPGRRYQTFSEMRRDLEGVYRQLTGTEYRSLAQALQQSGFERNCLGGWSEPGAIDHLVNLATAFHNLGQDDQAEPLLRQALQVSPDSSLVHASLALVLRRRGAIKEALSHLDFAAKACPNDPLPLHNMATTYMMAEQYREAMPLLDRALSLDPSLPGLWADNALCLERLGAYEKALTAVDRALVQAPRDPKGWALKAQILIGMKNGPGALVALERAQGLAATNDIAELCHALEREATALVDTSDRKHKLPAQGTPGTAGLRPLEFPYTIPLSRERREQIRSLLLGLKRPSKQITTAELAAAVIGDATGPLPTWAHDRQFESELEGLLESHMVLICLDCDGIIGFLDAPAGEDHGRLVRDMMLVQSREQFTCRVCGSKNMALCNPEVLRYGQKVDIQGHLRGMDGPLHG